MFWNKINIPIYIYSLFLEEKPNECIVADKLQIKTLAVLKEELANIFICSFDASVPSKQALASQSV